MQMMLPTGFYAVHVTFEMGPCRKKPWAALVSIGSPSSEDPTRPNIVSPSYIRPSGVGCVHRTRVLNVHSGTSKHQGSKVRFREPIHSVKYVRHVSKRKRAIKELKSRDALKCRELCRVNNWRPRFCIQLPTPHSNSFGIQVNDPRRIWTQGLSCHCSKGLT